MACRRRPEKRGAFSARLPVLLSKLLGKLTNQQPVSGEGGLLHALLQPGDRCWHMANSSGNFPTRAISFA